MHMTLKLLQAGGRGWLPTSRAALIGLAAAGGLLAAGCGSAAAPAPSPAHAGTSGGTSTTSAAKVNLDVTLAGLGPGPAKHWVLRCDPPGGNTPDAASMCQKLLSDKTVFDKTPGHIMCPMIMADAKSYIVNGTFFGKPIHESIVDGGCELARWAQLGQIFN
jgi:hypothetical protein